MITTFEQAKRLRKLGYSRECRNYYMFDKGKDAKEDSLIYGNELKLWNGLDHLNTIIGYCSAPLISEALDFIREEKGVLCAVELFRETDRFGSLIDFRYSGAYIVDDNKEVLLEPMGTFPEAESALLDALLDYLESRPN